MRQALAAVYALLLLGAQVAWPTLGAIQRGKLCGKVVVAAWPGQAASNPYVPGFHKLWSWENFKTLASHHDRMHGTGLGP